MNINNICRKDSIKCKVTGHNSNGSFLSIIGMGNSPTPTVRLFDCFIPKGSIVLVSVVSVADTHIKASLDSVINISDYDFAA